MKKLVVALGAVLSALLVLEVLVRLSFPSPPTVEVENVQPTTPQQGDKQTVQEKRTHNSVIDWSGHQGVRLRKNVRAQIRDHALSGRDIWIETSSIGLRYPEIGPKQPGEYRVLVLGDSITFGDFVDPSETYTGVLEKLSEGSSRTIRFINAGLPGASTSEEFYLYMGLRELVQPDLVLVQMYLNDSHNSEVFRARSLPPPYSYSRLLSLIADRFEIVRAQLWETSAMPPGVSPDWRETFRGGRDLRTGDMLNSRDGFDYEIYNAHMDFGLAWNPDSWNSIDRILRVWNQVVAETESKLAVVMFPVHIQVLGTIEDFVPQQTARRICRRWGIPFHDVAPVLRADWQERKERLFFDHCHPTPHAYRVVAKDLYAWLTRENLVPTGSEDSLRFSGRQ